QYSFFFFSSRRRHTRSKRDWSSDVCSSDLEDGLDIPATEFDDSNEITFQVPEEGIKVGPFKAGEEGTIEISAGQIDNTLESNALPLDAVCHPDDDDTVVNTIEIEDDGNGGDPEPNPEEEALDAVNEADDAEEMQ